MCFVHLLKDLHSYIYERDNYDYIKALETTVPRQQLHRDRDTVPAILTETQRHKDTKTHRQQKRHREREKRERRRDKDTHREKK